MGLIAPCAMLIGLLLIGMFREVAEDGDVNLPAELRTSIESAQDLTVEALLADFAAAEPLPAMDPSRTDPSAEAETLLQETNPLDGSQRTAAPVVTEVAGLTYGSPVHRIYRVTAYHDLGLTAAGLPSGVGQCAAPADVPFGSIIYIPELDQSFVVTDRTHRRFRHNTVDLFIPDRRDCIEFGRRYLECRISTPMEPPTYGSPVLRRLLAVILGS